MTSDVTPLFSRRAALVLASAGLAAFAARPALALTTAVAERYVADIAATVERIISSEKSEAKLFAEFEGLLTTYGDMPIIARFVLGPPARSASSSQMAAFTAAFQTYLARKYGKQFRRFIGAKVTVKSSQDLGGNKGVVVETNVKMVNEAPFIVHWRVSDRSGALKAIDLVVEGISMLSAEREEIRARYEQNGNNLDRLIKDLRSLA